MNILHNSFLTVEEQCLLSSLDGKTIGDCIEETEYLLSVTSTDDYTYSIILGLLDKLLHGHINLKQETEFLPDDSENE